MQYGKYIIFFLFLFPLQLVAQDITGLWKGTMFNDTTQQYYKYEIAISKEKGRYTGYSHTWFLLDDKQYYGVKKVKIKVADDGKIVTEDDGLIANNYPVAPNKNVRQLNILSLDDADSIMVLDGPFTTNRTKEYSPLTGHIRLQRKNDFWQSALVPHLQELGRVEELSFIKEEKEMLAATLKATNDSIAKASVAKAEKDAAERKAALEDQKRQQELAKQEAERKAAAEKEEAMAMAAQQKKLEQEQAAKDKAAKDLLAKQQAEARSQAEKQRLADAYAKKQQEDQATAAREQLKIAAEKKAAAEKAQALALLAEQKKAALAAEEKAALAKKDADAAAAKLQAEKESIAKKQAAVTKPAAPELAKSTAPAAYVNERTTVLQQTVSFSSDSLQLSLYDNGEVDGDSVSVLFNGELIIAKQGLGTVANKKTIYIPSNIDRVELVMYAESLGSIPPNTGLLVVRDGKRVYEIRFSGDMQKNASIVLNRKKE